MASGQRRSSPAPERPPGWPAGGTVTGLQSGGLKQLQVWSQGDSSSYRSGVRGTRAVTGLESGGLEQLQVWSQGDSSSYRSGVRGTRAVTGLTAAVLAVVGNQGGQRMSDELGGLKFDLRVRGTKDGLGFSAPSQWQE